MRYPSRPVSRASTVLAGIALACAAAGSAMLGWLAFNTVTMTALAPIAPDRLATPVVLAALPTAAEPLRRYPVAPTPILVQVIETPTPVPTEISGPALTATARAGLVCPDDAAGWAAIPEGASCTWAKPTPTPKPAPTALPRCITPVPGQRCAP